MITLEVMVEAGDWSVAGGAESDVAALAQRAASAAIAVAPGIVDEAVSATVLLADDAALRDLNRAWRGLDKPTNVLSFPSAAPRMPGELRHLGDIALAIETLQREADEEGKSLADHAAHLVVHGVLHLLGQDHEGEEDAEAMEQLEIAALARIGVSNPYAATEPTGGRHHEADCNPAR